MFDEEHRLLDTFKLRMRIFHDAEDENLNTLLHLSEKAVVNLCGGADDELILERSRYAYNDKLESFYRHFRNEVAVLNLANYNPDEEDANGEGDDQRRLANAD